MKENRTGRETYKRHTFTQETNMHNQELAGGSEGKISAAATPHLKKNAVTTNNGSTTNATELNLPGAFRAEQRAARQHGHVYHCSQAD